MVDFCRCLRLCLAVLLLCLSSGTSWAQPAGPTVVNGTAKVTTSGSTTTVNASNQAIINWNSFGVNANEILKFIQPNALATVLNRVTGVSPSVILGSIQSNGRVFILNPNGVLFGPKSQVQVGGLLATTLNMSNSDFIAGNYNLLQGSNQLASVVNQGKITAASGSYVVLVAPLVSNEGVIVANLGKVTMAGSQQAVIAIDGGLLNFPVTQVTSPGDIVTTSAAASTALQGVVTNHCIVPTGAVVKNGCAVTLKGSEGLVSNSGTITAGASSGTSNNTGGTITLNSTQATAVTPSGLLSNRGGLTNSNGGCINILSNGLAYFAGSITGQGGVCSGNGGNVDLSGKKFCFRSGTVLLGGTGANAKNGTLTLDPCCNLTATCITNALAGTITGALNNNSNVLVQVHNAGGIKFTNCATAITQSAGKNANLTISACAGDITESGSEKPITLCGNGNVTLKATGKIDVPHLDITANNGNITLCAQTQCHNLFNTFGHLVVGCGKTICVTVKGYIGCCAKCLNQHNVIAGNESTGLTGCTRKTCAPCGTIKLTSLCRDVQSRRNIACGPNGTITINAPNGSYIDSIGGTNCTANTVNISTKWGIGVLNAGDSCPGFAPTEIGANHLNLKVTAPGTSFVPCLKNVGCSSTIKHPGINIDTVTNECGTAKSQPQSLVVSINNNNVHIGNQSTTKCSVGKNPCTAQKYLCITCSKITGFLSGAGSLIDVTNAGGCLQVVHNRTVRCANIGCGSTTTISGITVKGTCPNGGPVGPGTGCINLTALGTISNDGGAGAIIKACNAIMHSTFGNLTLNTLAAKNDVCVTGALALRTDKAAATQNVNLGVAPACLNVYQNNGSGTINLCPTGNNKLTYDTTGSCASHKVCYTNTPNNNTNLLFQNTGNNGINVGAFNNGTGGGNITLFAGPGCATTVNNLINNRQCNTNNTCNLPIGTTCSNINVIGQLKAPNSAVTLVADKTIGGPCHSPGNCEVYGLSVALSAIKGCINCKDENDFLTNTSFLTALAPNGSIQIDNRCHPVIIQNNAILGCTTNGMVAKNCIDFVNFGGRMSICAPIKATACTGSVFVANVGAGGHIIGCPTFGSVSGHTVTIASTCGHVGTSCPAVCGGPIKVCAPNLQVTSGAAQGSYITNGTAMTSLKMNTNNGCSVITDTASGGTLTIASAGGKTNVSNCKNFIPTLSIEQDGTNTLVAGSAKCGGQCLSATNLTLTSRQSDINSCNATSHTVNVSGTLTLQTKNHAIGSNNTSCIFKINGSPTLNVPTSNVFVGTASNINVNAASLTVGTITASGAVTLQGGTISASNVPTNITASTITLTGTYNPTLQVKTTTGTACAVKVNGACVPSGSTSVCGNVHRQ